MTKAELITAISDKTGITKVDTQHFLEALAEIGSQELASTGEFAIPGFGKLTISERNAYMGRNPATGEAVEIAASKRIKFAATKSLKDAING